MKKLQRLVALLLTMSLIGTLVACGDGNGKKGKRKVTFWATVDDTNQELLNRAIKTFNEKHSDIAVTLVPQADGYSANLASTLRGSNPPDVVMVDDKYFKGYVKEGYFTKLDNYIAESKSENFSMDDMFSNVVNTFSYDPQTGYSGEGKNYYAIPNGVGTTILYYNKTAFESQNINIISVEESELDKYNKDNKSNFLPHGFYIYDKIPADGLKARSDGKYYVFNNKIPTNWDELVSLSKMFTKTYTPSSPTTYGFLNEWWFSYGWSVGGDCLEWDSDSNSYVFSLGDYNPNYLVTAADGLTINGTKYKSGNIISYADKKYIAENISNSEIAGFLSQQKLYRLPSTSDAFAEFCALSQKQGKTVTKNKTGYGISPSPTTLGNNSKISYFTTGEVAIVCEGIDALTTIGKTMKTLNKEWDVAPLYQYREYNSDGTVKTVNGTAVKGRQSTHHFSRGFAIPNNAKNKEAAWKFIEYMSGAEGQKIMMRPNVVPNQKSIAYSEEYLNCSNNYAPKNMRAIVDMAAIASVGDWSYVEDGEWINKWSNILNTSVRDGNMTLDQFYANETVKNTNELLKKYTSKKYNDKD